MTTDQHSSMNIQQTLSGRPQHDSSRTEIFRPAALTDIPELSKSNLLNMLNQIPDLKGRQFNIEYSSSTSASEGYPIPSNIQSVDIEYPEPSVIDQLPKNIIEHVKTSHNPAIVAALDHVIQQEQRGQSGGHQTSATVPTLKVETSHFINHVAQHNERVQQSRAISFNQSDKSSSEVSSSETSSSSEESDSDESQTAFLAKCLTTEVVAPIPST